VFQAAAGFAVSAVERLHKDPVSLAQQRSGLPRILFLRANSKLPRTLPLGLMSIAAYLRRRGPDLWGGGDRMRILDMRVDDMPVEQARGQIAAYQPDVVGITALSLEARAAHEMLAVARKECPHCLTLMGGPYPTATPELALADPLLDYAVLGEGEETAWELLAVLADAAGKDVGTVAGLAYRNAEGAVVRTEARPPILDMDALPWPAYDLVDMEAYFSQLHTHLSPQQAHARYAPVFTSRGCPYRCIYCQHMFGRQIRYRSPEGVLAQVRHLVETYGVREIHFEDDSFNVDVDRAKRIFDLLVEADLRCKIAFPNGVRGDRVDEELIARGKAAGLYSIAFGIESASPRILEMIHKGLSLEAVSRAIDLADRYGIWSIGFFMLGFPGETREEMEQTIDFAARSRLTTASLHSVIPLPATPLWDLVTRSRSAGAAHAGLLDAATEYDFEFTGQPLAAVDAKTFQALFARAFRRFYFRPRRLWRLWALHPDKAWLLRGLPGRVWGLLKRGIPLPAGVKQRLFEKVDT
jgi:anaerobic magnesium-protoporphyrin IX monomethyl ester cyclase